MRSRSIALSVRVFGASALLGAACLAQTDPGPRGGKPAAGGPVAGLSADELAAGDGRVRRFAQIAIRHADNHRTDIETALAAHGIRRG